MDSRKVLSCFALASVVSLAACGDSVPPVEKAEGAPPTVVSTDVAAGSPVDGTRENPMNIGDKRQLAEGSAFTVWVNRVNTDAYEELQPISEFLEAPPDGFKYVLVGVSATVDGDLLGEPFSLDDGVPVGSIINTEIITADGTSYPDYSSDEYCYIGNGDFVSQKPVYGSGAVTQGLVCIPLPEDAIEGSLIRIFDLARN